jgi:hypothetical protein
MKVGTKKIAYLLIVSALLVGGLCPTASAKKYKEEEGSFEMVHLVQGYQIMIEQYGPSMIPNEEGFVRVIFSKGEGSAKSEDRSNAQAHGRIIVQTQSYAEEKMNEAQETYELLVIIIIIHMPTPGGLRTDKYLLDGVSNDDREFQTDSHGYALTTYTFTADRLREE